MWPFYNSHLRNFALPHPISLERARLDNRSIDLSHDLMGLDVIMWKVSTREAKGDKGDWREGGSELVLVDHN